MKAVVSTILILSVILLALAGMAFAFTATPTGTEVSLTWNEPTTNSDGSALTDLAKIRVYENHTGSMTVAKEINATRPTGGGVNQSTVATVPILAGQEKDVSFYLTAVDTSGNESVPSNTKTVRIDRLAPSAPE